MAVGSCSATFSSIACRSLLASWEANAGAVLAMNLPQLLTLARSVTLLCLVCIPSNAADRRLGLDVFWDGLAFGAIGSIWSMCLHRTSFYHCLQANGGMF